MTDDDIVDKCTHCGFYAYCTFLYCPHCGAVNRKRVPYPDEELNHDGKRKDS